MTDTTTASPTPDEPDEPTNHRHVGPRVDPGWWDFARQITLFVFGIVVIIYAIATPGYDVPFLITGLVLLGIVPVDRAMDRWSRK